MSHLKVVEPHFVNISAEQQYLVNLRLYLDYLELVYLKMAFKWTLEITRPQVPFECFDEKILSSYIRDLQTKLEVLAETHGVFIAYKTYPDFLKKN